MTGHQHEKKFADQKNQPLKTADPRKESKSSGKECSNKQPHQNNPRYESREEEEEQ